MRNTIGDYIHLRRENYNNGKYVEDFPKSTIYDKDYASIALKKQKKEMWKLVSNLGELEIAKAMETELNEVFEQQTDENKDKYEAMIQAVKNEFPYYEDVIEEILTTIDIGKLTKDFSTSELTAISQKTNEKIKEIKNLLKQLKEKMITATDKTLGFQDNIITELSNYKNFLTEATIKKATKGYNQEDRDLIQKYNELLRNIKKQITNLFRESNRIIANKEIEDRLNKYPNITSKILSFKYEEDNSKRSNIILQIDGKKYRCTKERIDEAINALNEYIALMTLPAKLIGDVAEYALAGLAYYCDRERVDKHIKDYIFGGEASYVTYDASRFKNFSEKSPSTISNVLTKDKEFVSIIGKGNREYFKINGAATQDKIDVLFTIDDIKQILGDSLTATQDMRMSIKNYDTKTVSSKGFGGVSGSAFLYLIQLQKIGFINHWINLTICHEDDGASIPQDSLISDAHQIMLLTLIVIGAAGGTLKSKQNNEEWTVGKQDTANYLVWRAHSGSGSNRHKWRVYPMSYLLHPIFGKDEGTLKKSVEGYDNFYNVKEWHTTAENSINERLENILSFMHQQKITTHTPLLVGSLT